MKLRRRNSQFAEKTPEGRLVRQQSRRLGWYTHQAKFARDEGSCKNGNIRARRNYSGDTLGTAYSNNRIDICGVCAISTVRQSVAWIVWLIIRGDDAVAQTLCSAYRIELIRGRRQNEQGFSQR